MALDCEVQAGRLWPAQRTDRKSGSSLDRCNCPVASPPENATPGGLNVAKTQIVSCRCERCAHKWASRETSRLPKVCPKCKSPYWNTPETTPTWG